MSPACHNDDNARRHMSSETRTYSRRRFLGQAGGALLASALPYAALAQNRSVNDRIQVAAIGMGIMGFNNCSTTVKVPGVKLVAACDLYTGHLKRAKEVYGNDLVTTPHFEDILDNKSIDAV